MFGWLMLSDMILGRGGSCGICLLRFEGGVGWAEEGGRGGKPVFV